MQVVRNCWIRIKTLWLGLHRSVSIHSMRNEKSPINHENRRYVSPMFCRPEESLRCREAKNYSIKKPHTHLLKSSPWEMSKQQGTHGAVCWFEVLAKLQADHTLRGSLLTRTWNWVEYTVQWVELYRLCAFPPSLISLSDGLTWMTSHLELNCHSDNACLASQNCSCWTGQQFVVEGFTSGPDVLGP